MNWINTEAFVSGLENASMFVGFGVNWLLQSTLLILAGIVVAQLLKSRGSAVQSVVYRTTLVAVIACPVVTMLLAANGVTGWSVTMPKTWQPRIAEVSTAVEIEDSSEAEEPSDSGSAATNSQLTADRGANNLHSNLNESFQYPAESLTDDSLAGENQAVNTGTALADHQPQDSLEAESPTSDATSGLISIERFGILVTALVVAWIAVSLIFIGRLFFAWLSLKRLRGSATPAEPELDAICNSLASQMNVAAPEIFRSPFLPSPCLAGIRKPSILLPAEDCELAVQDLLVHELAHLRRKDCHWNLLNRLVSALLFFQPLIWVLSRKLELTAEEVCDDFVVQFGGNRNEYASRLVDIAELSTASIAPVGVGVVSFRSMLSQRVTRILDTSRALSTSASRLPMLSVLALGILGTAMTGMVGLKPGITEPEPTPIAINDEQEDSNLRFKGKVVDPAGQPAADAKLFLVFHVPEPTGLLESNWKPIATTDADGQFDFTVDKTLEGYQQFEFASVVATKDGFGLDWKPSQIFETSGEQLAELKKKIDKQPAHLKAHYQRMLDQEGKPLKLTKDDHSIAGRILDIDGQPVENAKVTLLEISTSENDDLAQWRKAAAEPKADYYSARTKADRMMNGPQVRSLVRPGTTDKTGQFSMTGIGNGRIARFLVEGPGIASEKVYARTEAGKDIELLESRRSPYSGSYTYHACQFTHLAGPSAAILGTVRDKKTKKPLAGITIKSQSLHGTNGFGWGQDFVRAITNKDGEFELNGLPIGSDNRIAFLATYEEIPYASASRSASTSSPDEPVNIDIDLNSGVWIQGQVTDKDSGKGIPGWVHYYASLDNPNAKDIGWTVDERFRMRADKEGNFKFVGLAGKGYVSFLAGGGGGREKYARSTFILKPDGTKQKYTNDDIEGMPLNMLPTNSSAITEINPTSELYEVNFELDSGRRLAGRVVDSDGKPVKDFYYTGRSLAIQNLWDQSENGSFGLVDYDEQEGRTVFVVTSDMKLAGSATLTGKQESEIAIKLQPAGSVKGRLVDEDGEPISDCGLRNWLPNFGSPMVLAAKKTTPPLPVNVAHSRSPRYETDSDGRFEIQGLVPGVEYRLLATRPKSDSRIPDVDGPIDAAIKVEPAGTVDLGDVQVVKVNEIGKLGSSSSSSVINTDSADRVIVTGTVFDADGAPAANANVEILCLTRGQQFGGLLFENSVRQPLGQVATNATGKFEIGYLKSKATQLSGYPNAWKEVCIAASSSDTGPAWIGYHQLKPGQHVELRLVADDVPVKGQLVDLEGKALPGVKVTIVPVLLSRSANDDLGPFLKAIKRGQNYMEAATQHAGVRTPQLPSTVPENTITDKNGRFEINGIGRDRLVHLYLNGPTIARTLVTVVTRDMDSVVAQGGWSGATVVYGANCQIAVEPSRAIRGIVKDAETGHPMAAVDVESYAMTPTGMSAQREIRVTSDAAGRFTITGMPVGPGKQIIAVPNDDQPYLMRVFDVPDQPGAEPIELDLELHRGVWITGRVTDKATGKPIGNPQAVAKYYPYRDNPFAAELPEYDSSGNFDGYQLRYEVSPDGTYRLVGLPGKAIVGISTMAPYRKGQGAEEISGADESGHYQTFRVGTEPSKKNPTALKEVSIDENAIEHRLDFELDSGKTIQITITDSNGNLLTGVKASGLRSHSWFESVQSNPVEAVSFGPGESRKMLFHDAAKKLGKVQVVTANKEAKQSQTIQLLPTVEVRGQLLDDNDEPIRDAVVGFRPLPGGDFAIDLPKVFTDDNGRFENLNVLPGADYIVAMESTTIGRKLIAKKLKVSSGESIDLGTINVTSDQRPEPIRKGLVD